MTLPTFLTSIDWGRVPFGLISFAFGIVLLLAFIIVFFRKRKPGDFEMKYYKDGWKNVQTKLKDESQWPQAIIEADELLEHALDVKRYKGKSMGERLVSAQRDIKDNAGVWFAHKLKKRIATESRVKLQKQDVRKALVSLRSALQDLGALK